MTGTLPSGHGGGFIGTIREAEMLSEGEEGKMKTKERKAWWWWRSEGGGQKRSRAAEAVLRKVGW